MIQNKNKEFVNLNNPIILVTNDDGINSIGIKILENVAKSLSNKVYVVAPESEQSAKSHSITLTQPIRINKLTKYRYTVSGTPADSVIFGVNEVLKKNPDLILSGINCGANMAEDVSYSGTIAAAIEGTLMGIPSIALSQVYRYPNNISWKVSQDYAKKTIIKICKFQIDQNILLNINFPDFISNKKQYLSITKQGKRGYEKPLIEKNIDPRGGEYYWLGYKKQIVKPTDNSDLSSISKGIISVSPLKIDFNNNASFNKLKANLSEV